MKRYKARLKRKILYDMKKALQFFRGKGLPSRQGIFTNATL